jgi:predicted ATPase
VQAPEHRSSGWGLSKLDARSTALRGFPSRSPFVGRRRELEVIEEQLAAGERLLVVLGAGGVGKTALAVQFALRHAEGQRSPHICYADLTDARTIEDLCAAIERALDLSSTRGATDGVARVGEVLRSRGRVWAILDNFEQLVPFADATLGRWLTLAPEASFLVTSRERLRLPSEHVVQLEPLAVPEAGERGLAHVAEHDAVKVFVDRARRAAPGFALSEDNADTVAALVRRVEGIPLAVELCAARMAILSPKELLDQLSRGFGVLAARERGAPDRRATLRGTIEWSWRLLEPAERAALAWLSVFRGGFTLEAAASVLPPEALGDAALVERLHALHDKSLLRVLRRDGPRDEVRHGMFESVREFAAERAAESAIGEAARAALAAWLLPKVEGEADVGFVDRELENFLEVFSFARDRADATTALRAALAVETALYARGSSPLLLRVVEQAMALPERPEDTGLRVRLLLRCTFSLRQLARHADQFETIERARRLARGAADSQLEARCLLRLAGAHSALGETGAAEAALEQATRLAEGLDDAILSAETAGLRGHLAFHWGHRDQCRDLFLRARAAYTRAGDAIRAAEFCVALGACDLADLRFKAARARFEEARAEAKRLGVKRLVEEWCVPVAAYVEGDMERAEALFAQALRASRLYGNRRSEAWLRCYFGAFEFDRGNEDAAREHFRASVPTLMELGPVGLAGMELAAIAGSEEALAYIDGLRAAPARGGPTEYGPVLAIYAHGARARDETRRARAAALRDVFSEADRHLAAARRRLEEEDAALPSRAMGFAIDLRIAAGMLRREVRSVEAVLAARRRDGGPGGASRVLLYDADGRWFQVAGGDRVSFGRSRSTKLLFLCLVRRHGGGAVSMPALREAGWPGEKISAKSATNRVYVALNRLRELGLRAYLLSRDDGWLLDPSLRLATASRGTGPLAAPS